MFSVATISFQPVLPVWLILLLWFAAVVWGWLSLRGCGLKLTTSVPLMLLRTTALSILVWLLLAPERRRENVEKELPVLAVAVDVSASMTEQIGDQRETRAARAQKLLDDGRFRSELGKFRVWWYEVGEGLDESQTQGKKLAFSAAQSNLTPALNRLAARLQTQNAAGIILLSDGLDQSGAALAPEARAIPIYTVELEDEMKAVLEKPDFWIADLTYPQRAVINWQVGIEVMIRRRTLGKATFPVRLLQNGREVQTQTLSWDETERFKQVPFTLTPAEVGQILLRVEIQPPAEDANPDNNFREFLIDVTDPQNRVLYIEGVPRWEFKFLKRALMGDKSVVLSSFVSTGTGGFVGFSDDPKAASETVPPFTREGLQKYKVVILGNLPADALKPQDYQGLRDFVDRGGGLLLLGGDKAYTMDGWVTVPAMKELMPALPQAGTRFLGGDFALDVTPAGKGHPALQGLGLDADLPHLLSICQPMRPTEFSTVLLTTIEGAALLVVRPFGQGKAAMVLSDTFWRWQLGNAGITAGGKNPYQLFFAQLANWLGPNAKEQDTREMLQLLLARNEVDVRQKITVGARMESQGKAQAGELVCRIDPPDGKPLTIPMVPGSLGENVGLSRTLDGYVCEFRPDKSGSYTVTVTSRNGQLSTHTKLLAREPLREKTGAVMDRSFLEDLARASGGKFIPWKDRSSLFKAISRQARELRTIVEYPLWPKAYWLLALIALFAAEWYWRRKLDFV